MMQGEDGLLRTWNTTSWEPGADLPGSIANLMNREVDADMNRVATVQSGRSIQLHDARTGEPIFTLRGHEQDINLLRFSPSGNQLVSIDSDGRIRVWNTLTIGQADGLRQLQDETWAIYEPRVLDWIDQADGDDQRLAEIIKLESTGLNAIEIEAINDLALLHALPERMPSGR
jgi:WD40 repeat protein